MGVSPVPLEGRKIQAWLLQGEIIAHGRMAAWGICFFNLNYFEHAWQGIAGDDPAAKRVTPGWLNKGSVWQGSGSSKNGSGSGSSGGVVSLVELSHFKNRLAK
jgi:hypothetical protein